MHLNFVRRWYETLWRYMDINVCDVQTFEQNNSIHTVKHLYLALSQLKYKLFTIFYHLSIAPIYTNPTVTFGLTRKDPHP